MRRLASEIIRNLEMRVARLERTASKVDYRHLSYCADTVKGYIRGVRKLKRLDISSVEEVLKKGLLGFSPDSSDLNRAEDMLTDVLDYLVTNDLQEYKDYMDCTIELLEFVGDLS
tara:strand:- start:225 stop:569 length:345 start_codon:yes stop_codon:yes gene_type:complete